MKKMLAFLIFPLVLFADYDFVVETPEIADSYFNVFNGIAMIFSSQDYLALLKLVFLFGGFATFTMGVLTSWGKDGKGAISDYTKYSLIGVAFLSMIFSSSTTIWVKSETLPTFCNATVSPTSGFAVANIPSILAYGFNFANRLGREMTRIAEQAYSIPSAFGDTSMTKSGGYIGSLKQAIGVLGMNFDRVTLNDYNLTETPYELSKMSSYILSDCILVPFSGKGADGLAEISLLKSSKDIGEYLTQLYATNKIIGGIPAGEYSLDFGGERWTCGAFFTYMLPYINKFKTQSICAYKDVGAGAIQLLTGKTADLIPIADFQQVALQSGLITQLEETSMKLGINTPGVAYLTGKSKADFINSSMAKGAYMAEMLPYMQMTIRAILYAFFPFCFVIIMLPGGTMVLKQYAQSIIWVELWSPTAAILNMFISQQAQYKIGGEFASNGMTLSNSVDMLSSASTISGVANYLYMSVPALTWLILKGSATMLSHITSGITQTMGQSAKMNQTLAQDKSQLETVDRSGFGSIAELQHYQAIQQGATEGKSLAYQKSQGIELVSDNALYKSAQDLEKYKSMMEQSVNSTSSAVSVAKAQSIPESIQGAVNANLGANGNFQNLTNGIYDHKTKELIAQGSVQNTLNNNNGQNEYNKNEMMKTEKSFDTNVKTFNMTAEAFKTDSPLDKMVDVSSTKATGDLIKEDSSQKKFNELGGFYENQKNIGTSNAISQTVSSQALIDTEQAFGVKSMIASEEYNQGKQIINNQSEDLARRTATGQSDSRAAYQASHVVQVPIANKDGSVSKYSVNNGNSVGLTSTDHRAYKENEMARSFTQSFFSKESGRTLTFDGKEYDGRSLTELSDFTNNAISLGSPIMTAIKSPKSFYDLYTKGR